MTVAQKWDPYINMYHPYLLPDGAKTYTTDMNEKIACAQCGTVMLFGDGYTSKQIHTEIGLGYAVCGVCYDTEWADEAKAEAEAVSDK